MTTQTETQTTAPAVLPQIRWSGHSTSVGGVNYTNWLPTVEPIKIGGRVGQASAHLVENERGEVSIQVSMPVGSRREGLRILRALTETR